MWLALLALTGCEVEGVRNADLQLDIAGADLGEDPDEAIVRICVQDVGNHEEALGAGAIAFTGLPPDQAVVLSVHVLAADDDERSTGSVGPVQLGPDQPYLELDWGHCIDECVACQASGERVAAGEDDALLAVRFLDL